MTQNRQPDQINQISLCLLATTDLHMHLTGWDYAKDRPLPRGGLGRVAEAVARIRSEAAAKGVPVLLFDNGDGSQGTVLGDLAQQDRDHPHPLMRCFAQMGYDAVGLGNHDFDYGTAGLAHLLAHAPCPVVSAVLDPVPQSVRRSAVLAVETEIGPLRIGLLSVLPPQTALWNADRIKGQIRFQDMVTAAEQEVARLRATGCDLVVALAHTGIGDPAHVPGQENAVHPIAALNVDAVFAGHTHLPFAGMIENTPVVLAGANGSQLARIDLRLERQEDRWSVAQSRPTTLDMAENSPDDALPADPVLRAIVKPWHMAAQTRMNAPVGHSARPLHSFFSMVRPDAHLHLIAEAMHLAALEGDTPLPELPILAAMAPAKCGGRGGPEHYTDVPAGPVLERHVQDLVLFPNLLRAVTLSGAKLLNWMEMAASVFHPLSGAEIALLNAAWPPHSFDTFFGLDYEIDLNALARYQPDGQVLNPGASRIRNARCNGVPLHPDDNFVVLLTDYRASGGGNVPGLTEAERLDIPPTPLRHAIARLLSDGFTARYAPHPWQFADAHGAKIQFQTGPGALTHLADISSLSPQVGTLDSEGFVPITLTL